MPELSRKRLNTRRFHDPKNYPYGFSRSGDFTIAESRALSEYGALLQALTDGVIEPASDSEENILAVAQGNALPQTSVERVWLKYLKRIHRVRPRGMHGCFATEPQSDAVDEDALPDFVPSENPES